MAEIWGAAIAAAGAIGGALITSKGSKQSAPAQAGNIDLQAQQKAAVQGNLQNQGDIESLVSQANTFQQQQAISMINQAIPGYSGLQSKLTSTASGLLTDPYSLPKDVQDNLSRLAAEKGISAGTRGQFNDFSLLRDFGVNELQYGAGRIGQAQSLSSTIAQLAPKVNPLSPMSFYVTPDQTANIAAGNRSATQAGYNATAAASNYGNANTWDSLGSAVGMLAGNGTLGRLGNGISNSGSNLGNSNSNLVATWGPITPEDPGTSK